MIAVKKLRWKIYSSYSKQLMLWGLKSKYIQPYGEGLIKKLRSARYYFYKIL